MPIYNCRDFVAEAIQSVSNQTYTNFEFIIINDGSIDESLQICEAFSATDRRIQIIDQANAGVAAAMNRGIAAAQGKWIVVMHSDDVMLPNRLERIATTIAETADNIGIVTAGVELISSDGRILGKANPSVPQNPFFLSKENHNHIIGGLYHTAISRDALLAVGGYDTSCRVNEDVNLYNKIIENGFGVLILPDVLMRYRIHPAAASSGKDRSLMLHWRYLKSEIRARRGGLPVPSWNDFIAIRRNRPWFLKFNEWRKDTAKMHYRRAAGALSARRWGSFATNSLMSLVLQPSHFVYKWKTRRR